MGRWIIILVAMLLFLPATSNAQLLGNNYIWTDSIAVSTTIQDSTWAGIYERWEQVTLWFSGCGGMVKIGAPDTTGFSSRDWIELYENRSLTIGPYTRLRRLWFRSDTGSGVMYMIGFKKTQQHGS